MRWIFLDRITEIVPGEHAVGLKGVASSEDFFADHFPGFPVVPGVVQIEALAQLSGKLVQVSVVEQKKRWVWPILSIVRKAKFRRFVRPGSSLELRSELSELRDESALCKVQARCEGERTTEAELLFVFSPGGLDTDHFQAELETYERKALQMLWADFPNWDARMRSER